MADPSVIRRGLDALLAHYPERDVFSVDWMLPHPLEVYEVDEEGNRASRPYRRWDLPAGPWCVVRLITEEGHHEEFAIWKPTGAVYRVGPTGAVEEDPMLKVASA